MERTTSPCGGRWRRPGGGGGGEGGSEGWADRHRRAAGRDIMALVRDDNKKWRREPESAPYYNWQSGTSPTYLVRSRRYNTDTSSSNTDTSSSASQTMTGVWLKLSTYVQKGMTWPGLGRRVETLRVSELHTHCLW